MNTGPAIPAVHAVVVNYKGMADTQICMATLEKQHYRRVQVWLVDNGSSDGSPEWVEEHCPRVRVIRNGANLGWSGGNNVGVRAALEEGADYIWLLNNDVELEPDCLGRLVEYAEEHRDVGICGPLIYDFSRRDSLSLFAGGIHYDRASVDPIDNPAAFEALPEQRRYISGCAMFIRAEVFRKVGLIDERFFLYFEDVDFCLRAAKAGFSSAVVRDARMYHKLGSTAAGEAPTSPVATYHGLRSNLLFWRKHASWWRFHRVFCGGHLGKWLNRVDLAGKDEMHRKDALAVIDAIWYVLAGKRDSRAWPESPEWFRRFVMKRPWLIGELMSFRFMPLLFRRRTV
ncbi:MAG: glycosyltransferase family 2 protein [Phycisphaerae bacterium]|nr:glycosyltransferase family 2 protein [Phycisphaerae bacterium]